MNPLLTPWTLASLSLRNRIVRSATWEGACDDAGQPTDKTIDYYRALAQGGVGLIISGYTFVTPEGKQQKGQAGLYNDAFSAAFRGMAEAVHAHQGKVVLQLVHTGGQANPAQSGHPAVAPSAVETAQYAQTPQALDAPGIQRLIEAFATAAARAKQWGFDGVQLHAAHGYLINQFLSPVTNQRTDEWGGSAENWRRFLCDIVRAVRRQVGDDFALLVKLSACDHLPGGLSEDEAVAAAMALDALGVDAIEVSSGTAASGVLGPTRTGVLAPEAEAYNASHAARIKAAVRCPVIAVGGFRSVDVAQRVLETGGADAVAMSRPFIREPDLAMRWQNGDLRAATCVSCNRCFVAGFRGGIRCLKR